MRKLRFLPEGTLYVRRIQRLMHRMLGDRPYVSESETPLKYSEPDEKDEWLYRRGVRIRIWRAPNGMFARNPYRRRS